MGALSLVVFCAWAAVFDKWSPTAFTRPIGYVLDGMFTLSLVKAGADFAFVPFFSKENPQLGAPFVANWNDFPLSDDHVFFFWGQVSRLTGVIAALNLAYLTSALGAALTLYAVGRWLRLRWEACFLAGALFGLSPFLFYRSVHHFTLVNYWHLPLMIPLVLWVGGRGLAWNSRRFRWAVAIAALAGFYNVYYLNYCLQLIGLGILAQIFRRRWSHAVAGVLVALAGAGAFGLSNLDTLVSQSRLGSNPAAIHRGAVDVEIYALRPFELFVPGLRHRADAFAAAADRHRRSALAVGEFPSMYLGIVGGFGLVCLMVVLMRTVLLGKRLGWGKFGFFCVWLIFVTMDGGLMQILQSATGTVLFRSNNRVSIFILMFALLFLARLLTKWLKSAPRVVSWGAVAVVLALGVWDQTPTSRIDPNVPHWETVAQREKVALADEHLVAAVEKKLPEGTSVYQLPAMQFPEAGFLGRLPDYDQFRPYLFSKTLKFSYGNMKGRKESNWQNEVAGLPDAQRLAELERRGFGAIYVLRFGYQPEQVEQFLTSMRALGQTEVIESEYGDSFFVLLQKAKGS